MPLSLYSFCQSLSAVKKLTIPTTQVVAFKVERLTFYHFDTQQKHTSVAELLSFAWWLLHIFPIICSDSMVAFSLKLSIVAYAVKIMKIKVNFYVQIWCCNAADHVVFESVQVPDLVWLCHYRLVYVFNFTQSIDCIGKYINIEVTQNYLSQ